MKSYEIRERFLRFFKNREHIILDSAPLVTRDDTYATNATLFNTAGMQPLIEYLMGTEHPQGKRLASSQKCLRTNDLEEVGDNTHATFFEMLGNWSLGDYFKREAITWSYQFLTDLDEGLGLDPNRLYVTVFAGNEEVPRDMESVEIWKELIPEHRIYFRDSKDNWWSAGPYSPAGPSTEMFYDLTGELGNLSPEEFEQADESQKIVEIWNDVFMTYQLKDGIIVGNLPQKNVDTGSGLERITAVVQGVQNIFETDLYKPLIDILKEFSRSYDEVSARIIADHIKASLFLISENILPTNTGRGYILRRIIRRSYTSSLSLSITDIDKLIERLIQELVVMYRDIYFAHHEEEVFVASSTSIIQSEMSKIEKIIKRAHSTFKKLQEQGTRSLEAPFLIELEQTHGIPLQVAIDLSKEYSINISQSVLDECEQLREQHQELSRKGAEKKFKGGLEQDTQKIRALHTATHLMLAALRKYLGDEVYQKGSNITEERSRFDFNYPEKVSDEILKKVEAYVNEALASDALVSIEYMKKFEAQNTTDIVGSFWEKYPDEVQVYTIADSSGKVYSRELCGGPHVERLSDILQFGNFVITKEEAVSAGVRRIRAELIH